MTVQICMTLVVPNNFDEAQVCEDIENGVANRTCFDVCEFLTYEELEGDGVKHNEQL